jgi:glutathione-regulated potassium-efflux system ancillary protein KefG
MPLKIRILVAHPDMGKSVANKCLLDAVRDLPGVEIVDLRTLLSGGTFPVENELDALRNTDVLVWQFPLYWYSSPAILRDWQDQVLSAAVYGKEKFLPGKKLMAATTVGARESTYRSGDLNRYSLDEFLRPMEACAHSAQMTWLPHFAVYEAENPENLRTAAKAYRARLEELLN